MFTQALKRKLVFALALRGILQPCVMGCRQSRTPPAYSDGNEKNTPASLRETHRPRGVHSPPCYIPTTIHCVPCAQLSKAAEVRKAVALVLLGLAIDKEIRSPGPSLPEMGKMSSQASRQLAGLILQFAHRMEVLPEAVTNVSAPQLVEVVAVVRNNRSMLDEDVQSVLARRSQ